MAATYYLWLGALSYWEYQQRVTIRWCTWSPILSLWHSNDWLVWKDPNHANKMFPTSWYKNQPRLFTQGSSAHRFVQILTQPSAPGAWLSALFCSLHPHPQTAFAWAFSCLCVAWPCSTRSRQQKPNQRQHSRGAVCSNQVTGLFRTGSEIIASRSQGRGWPSPRGLIGSWPSQTQQGSVSGQLRLCRLWLCDSTNERGHQESSSSDVSGSMSWQSWEQATGVASPRLHHSQSLCVWVCKRASEQVSEWKKMTIYVSGDEKEVAYSSVLIPLIHFSFKIQ